MLVPIVMAWVYPTIGITIAVDRDVQMLDGSITLWSDGLQGARWRATRRARGEWRSDRSCSGYEANA